MNQTWSNLPSKGRIWTTAILLAVGTFLLFSQALRFDFLVYDDNDYVTKNPVVQRGVTWDGVKWAFGDEHVANWHPLTWISHMTDCALFGLRPAGHHCSSIAVHSLSASLLFFLLLNFGIPFWRSTVCSAIFAWHPLRVESVAWVAERKDVLSVFFALLALLAYVNYVHASPGAGGRRKTYYVLALVCFVLSLLSKAMMVTLPFLLLLLDYWPLARFDNFQVSTQRFRRLFWEKIPFISLSGAMVIVTLWAQSKGGAVASIERVSVLFRLQNAVVALMAYVGKILWPADLAVLYPLPTSISLGKFVACAALVGAVTAAILRYRRTSPFLVTGWFWFVVALLPVIGLVQVGGAALSDRYTYAPMIGLLLIVAGLPGIRVPSAVLATVSVAALAACALTTRYNLQFWQNNFSLFSHAAAVTEDNYVAHYNVANMLVAAGQTNAALAEYQESIRINPRQHQLYNNYGKALAGLGRQTDAIAAFQKAIELNSDYALAYLNMGAVLADMKQLQPAETALQRAVILAPHDAEMHLNLGNVFFREHRSSDALREYQLAIAEDPSNATPHLWVARLSVADHPDLAIKHLHRAVELQPEWPVPCTDLAWLLATYPDEKIRNGSEAVRLAEKACALTKFKDVKCLSALDAAYAEAGQFAKAIAIAEQGQELAQSTGKTALAAAIQQRIELYRDGKPFYKAL